MSARLISTSIPNLLKGVSQQPNTVKLPNQSVLQENGLSDIISGLGKRHLKDVKISQVSSSDQITY